MEIRNATGEFPGTINCTICFSMNEWSRLQPLPLPFSQPASVAFLFFYINVPPWHPLVSSPRLFCLLASPNSSLELQPNSIPFRSPITGRTCPMPQLAPKPLMGCCLTHLLPAQLHFLAQLMLLRSQRMTSLHLCLQYIQVWSQWHAILTPLLIVPLPSKTLKAALVFYLVFYITIPHHPVPWTV